MILKVGRGLRTRRESATTCAAGSESPRNPAIANSLVLVPVLVLAFWPVWRWCVARMTDRSDEPLGLIALLTAAALLPRRGWRDALPTGSLVAVVSVTAAYVAAFDRVPLLVRGAFAVLAIACVLPRDRARSPLPLVALLLLSLPLIATLQFYLGFPVRAVTAWCAAHVLTLAGYATTAHGTILHWAGEEILVDAPCSGIRMLWTASYLSATLAAVHRLPARRFLRLAQWTAAVVFLANLARTVLLFFLETGLWPNPAWAHEAAGLAMFLVAAGACVAAAGWLRPAPACTHP